MNVQDMVRQMYEFLPKLGFIFLKDEIEKILLNKNPDFYVGFNDEKSLSWIEFYTILITKDSIYFDHISWNVIK